MEEKSTLVRIDNKIFNLLEFIVEKYPIYHSPKKLIETAVIKMILDNNLAPMEEIIKDDL